jgi:hypothetical protein
MVMYDSFAVLVEIEQDRRAEQDSSAIDQMRMQKERHR